EQGPGAAVENLEETAVEDNAGRITIGPFDHELSAMNVICHGLLQAFLISSATHFNRLAASSTKLRSASFFTSMVDFTNPRSRVKSTLPCRAARLGTIFAS